MIELHEWVEYVKQHPLLFRFEGLRSRGRGAKSDFFKNVCEAAMADERFMSERASDEYESHEKIFDQAVSDRKDYEGYLARFCAYVQSHVSYKKWMDSGLHSFEWDTAPAEELLKVVSVFGSRYKDGFLRDWCVGDVEVCPDEAEHLLKEHPPISAWYYAGEHEIPLTDIFFVCPSCHGEPHTEDLLIEFHGKHNGYPNFYCGSCGASMNVGEQEDIRDFFIAMDIKPYPFNPEKAAQWQKLLSDRKAS